MNINRYVDKYQNISFANHPFSDVDSLILCQISYQDFDDVFHNFNKIIYVRNLVRYKNVITCNTLYPQKNRKLIEALSQGTRFANLQMRYFNYSFSNEQEIQFAAMTFIGNDFAYICFRGTDITITGWKEDLWLATKDILPSQALAKEYVEKVIPLIPSDKKIFLGGHSKGGNLAIYAGAFVKKEYQDRIANIYDHDSPGFSYNIYEMSGLQNILARIKRTIPRNSLIGVLLNDNNHAQIIKSRAITGLYQHDPFRWCIKRNGLFKNYDKRSKSSRKIETIVDDIITNMTEKEKIKLIRLIGTWFDTAGIKTVKQIKTKVVPLLKSIRRSINNDENQEIRKNLKLIVPLILKSVIYHPRVHIHFYRSSRIKHLSNETL